MEITYLCPVETKPVGGIKVIYKHSEILKKMGVLSSVYHPKNPDFVCSWFDHQATTRGARPLVTGKDFVVIPEVWALGMGDRCLKTNTDYAVFVQGGYLLESGVPPQQYDRLKEIYEGAKLVMSISSDTSEVLCTAFPKLNRSQICRLLPHVGRVFRPQAKEKIISYMTSRLPEHVRKLRFLLREYLNNDWVLVPIDNMTELETANVLGKSSIFLSFSDQEGFALPPLEAAFSGAMVVGYTGQAAKEYFREPNFWPIENGNFIAFVQAVRKSMKDVENGLLDTEHFRAGIAALRDRYGEQNELAHLHLFVEEVRNLCRFSAQ